MESYTRYAVASAATTGTEPKMLKIITIATNNENNLFFIFSYRPFVFFLTVYPQSQTLSKLLIL